MDHPIFTASVLVIGLCLAVVAQWRGWRPTLPTALAVGIGLRLVLLFSAAADSWQPTDLNWGFRHAGQAVLAHQDPVLATQGSWHFLPMIPYLYALGLRAGLPWEIAGRLVTVAADIVLIPLVGRLAGGRNSPAARFAYACNPIALMVAAIHGQIEPVALMFLTAAYLAARAGRGGWAGALFGFALSTGSWPVIMLPALLATLPNLRERLNSVVTAGAVPVFFLVTMPLVLSVSWSDLLNVAKYLGGVRPIIGEWGWTAWLTGGDWALAPTTATIGQIILYATLIAVLWLWRRADRIDMTSAVLLAFLIVTPRMGAQYLLWFVPFLIARPTRFSRPAMALAAVWAGLGYIYLTRYDWWHNHEWWSRSSIVVIAALALAMPWATRRGSAAGVRESQEQVGIVAVPAS
jgi:hypothetical protein